MGFSKVLFSVNFSLKYFLLIIFAFCLIFFLLQKEEYNHSSSLLINNKKFENEFKTHLCKVLNGFKNQTCFDNIFINLNFFNEINEIPSNITLLIDLNKTNIENLLLLMGTIPFIKNNSIISYNIINEKTLNTIRAILKYKSFIKNSINIDEHDFNLIKDKIINCLNYDWELLPSQNIINIIRYTLNNYYNETTLELFDSYLNFNYKYYLATNILSFDTLQNLISKFLK